jgi:hypothetical protein
MVKDVFMATWFKVKTREWVLEPFPVSGGALMAALPKDQVMGAATWDLPYNFKSCGSALTN